jgi:hypothetical protein
VGNIVLGVKNGFIVNSAITAAGAILGHCIIITAITPFIGTPVVVALFLGLSPGVITAVILGGGSADIACCPL